MKTIVIIGNILSLIVLLPPIFRKILLDDKTITDIVINYIIVSAVMAMVCSKSFLPGLFLL